MQEAITTLLRIKRIIDGLSAINQMTLTETERQALEDCLSQAYDRAAYFISQIEQFLEQEGEQDQQQPILNGRKRAGAESQKYIIRMY